MLAAEDAWRDALRVQTLADLVRDGETLIDERNKEAISAFVQNAQR
jgi:DNA-binding IscR family transcriptional regulator